MQITQQELKIIHLALSKTVQGYQQQLENNSNYSKPHREATEDVLKEAKKMLAKVKSELGW